MDMAQRIDRVVDDAIEGNKIVGAVILVLRDGEIVYRRVAGMADREAGKAITEDAIFRLASLTKPIVATTSLAMIDAGLLGLDDAVSTHLPYFRPKLADGREPDITIRHLLTHTAGLSYSYPSDPSISCGLDNTDMSFEETFSRVAALPLAYEPGTAWDYAISIDVLGAVLAKVHGGSLGDAVATYVTNVVGMDDTAFAVSDMSRLATPYGDAVPVPLRMGEPHTVIDAEGDTVTFSPQRIFNAKAYQSGGAGMAGTAKDFMKLLEALRKGGTPVLKPETLAAATRNQIGDLYRERAGQRFGFLGAVVADPVAAETPQSAGTYNWGGIYGHSWFVDPVEGLTVVSFTNTGVEGCTGQFPNHVRDAVYGR